MCPHQSPAAYPTPQSILCESDLLCPPLQLHLSPRTSFNPSHPPLPKCCAFKHLKMCWMFGILLSWSCHHQQPGDSARTAPLPETFPAPHSGLSAPLQCPHGTLSLPIRLLISGIKIGSQSEPAGTLQPPPSCRLQWKDLGYHLPSPRTLSRSDRRAHEEDGR